PVPWLLPRSTAVAPALQLASRPGPAEAKVGTMEKASADELGRLGPLVQTHETVVGPPVYTVVIKTLLAGTGLLMLGVSGLFIAFLIRPFGTNPPPAGVALGLALGSAVLGVLMLAGSVTYDALSLLARSTPRGYVVDDDALVIRTSNRPTVLR